MVQPFLHKSSPLIEDPDSEPTQRPDLRNPFLIDVETLCVKFRYGFPENLFWK